MPLNDIAIGRLKDWFSNLHGSIDNEMFTQITDLGRDISSMGQIFTEDDEWSKELVTSGLLLTLVPYFLRKYEDINEDIQNAVKKQLHEDVDIILNSIDKNDWLQFHKSIRDIVYNINQIM